MAQPANAATAPLTYQEMKTWAQLYLTHMAHQNHPHMREDIKSLQTRKTWSYTSSICYVQAAHAAYLLTSGLEADLNGRLSTLSSGTNSAIKAMETTLHEFTHGGTPELRELIDQIVEEKLAQRGLAQQDAQEVEARQQAFQNVVVQLNQVGQQIGQLNDLARKVTALKATADQIATQLGALPPNGEAEEALARLIAIIRTLQP